MSSAAHSASHLVIISAHHISSTPTNTSIFKASSKFKMQLSLFSLTAMASIALAAPENPYPPSDNVSITGFTVTRDVNGNPTSVSLQLDGTHVTGLKCESDNPTIGGQSADRIECDDPDYSFILNPEGTNSYYLHVINHYNPG